MPTYDPAQEPQPRSTFSVWIGVLLLFAFFGLLVLVVLGASPRGDTYEERRAKVRAEKLKAARDEATKTLTSYAWVNKDKGVVRIPINEAMKLTVAELAQKKPMPANPIVTPAANLPTQAAAPSGASAAPPNAQAQPPSAPAAKPSPTGSPAHSPATAPVVPAAASPSASAPGTPLPVPGKTP